MEQHGLHLEDMRMSRGIAQSTEGASKIQHRSSCAHRLYCAAKDFQIVLCKPIPRFSQKDTMEAGNGVTDALPVFKRMPSFVPRGVNQRNGSHGSRS